jgi:hypothetical protein
MRIAQQLALGRMAAHENAHARFRLETPLVILPDARTAVLCRFTAWAVAILVQCRATAPAAMAPPPHTIGTVVSIRCVHDVVDASRS